MTGSIDLVFEEGGKYYFLDWKTDRLGPSFSDYAPYPNLWAAMVERSYLLQYFIYSLALHRYLTVRLPGYTFETHFGGGFYLFVRGVDVGNGNGVFSHCIDRNTLAKLERIFPETGGINHE